MLLTLAWSYVTSLHRVDALVRWVVTTKDLSATRAYLLNSAVHRAYDRIVLMLTVAASVVVV